MHRLLRPLRAHRPTGLVRLDWLLALLAVALLVAACKSGSGGAGGGGTGY